MRDEREHTNAAVARLLWFLQSSLIREAASSGEPVCKRASISLRRSDELAVSNIASALKILYKELSFRIGPGDAPSVERGSWERWARDQRVPFAAVFELPFE